MIVRCHKPAQIKNKARMNRDTIYITTSNGSDPFKTFNITNVCKHDFYGIIIYLKSSYYNCTDRIASKLCYGMIKYNKNEDSFIINDRNRTMIYYWKVGFLVLKALRANDKWVNVEINKFIDYMKPLKNNAKDINTVNTDNY